MPKLVMNVPETGESMTRPIVFDIVRAIMRDTGLPSDTKIYCIGKGVSLSNNGSELVTEATNNRLVTDARVKIEIEEEYDENYALSQHPSNKDNSLVFLDSELKVSIRPLYERIKVSINVDYRAPDVVVANNWLRRIKQRLNKDMVNGLHTVTYHFPMPVLAMEYLQQIFANKNANRSIPLDLGDWIIEHFTKKLQVVSDQGGVNPVFVIQESQVDVLGYYEFGYDVPKASQEKDTGVAVTGFTYKFEFWRCEHLLMEFPLLINNALLPDKFYPYDQEYDGSHYLNEPDLANQLYQYKLLREHAPKPWLTYPGLPVPFFDDWVPKVFIPMYFNLFRFLVQVDYNNPTDVISLKNLGAWDFKEKFIAYLVKTGSKVFIPYESVLLVRLHKWNDPLHPTKLLIDQDLNIRTTTPLDPLANYHLTIDIVGDIFRLVDREFEDLLDDKDVLDDIIKIVYPDVGDKVDYDEDKDELVDEDGKVIPDKDIIDIIKKYPDPTDKTLIYAFFRGYHSVIAHRQEPNHATN